MVQSINNIREKSRFSPCIIAPKASTQVGKIRVVSVKFIKKRQQIDASVRKIAYFCTDLIKN